MSVLIGTRIDCVIHGSGKDMGLVSMPGSAVVVK